MLSKYFLSVLLITSSVFSVSASAYWTTTLKNSQSASHFDDMYVYSQVLDQWQIEPGDHYVFGRFAPWSINTPLMLAIKPGKKFMITSLVTNHSQWWYHGSGTSLNGWHTRADDFYVSGDFTGNGYDELLLANPDGRYQTLQGDGSVGGNGPWVWTSLQYASNGDIDADDRLLAGDFDGDGIDELLLIKQNGWNHTIKFNTQTSNWDIFSSASNGHLHWWRVGADDTYAVGDYDGDGRDELLAVNPNGWEHTMEFVNNQWRFQSGNSGQGRVAWWNIGQTDIYTTVQPQFLTNEQVIVTNPVNGWSHTMKYENNQWKFEAGNGGDGKIGQWRMSANDHYVARQQGSRTFLMMFSTSGQWNVLQ